VGNLWSRQSKMLATDGVGNDRFGISANVYESIAMIGAIGDSDKTASAGIPSSSTCYK
jgi:hypothetical protein